MPPHAYEPPPRSRALWRWLMAAIVAVLGAAALIVIGTFGNRAFYAATVTAVPATPTAIAVAAVNATPTITPTPRPTTTPTPSAPTATPTPAPPTATPTPIPDIDVRVPLSLSNTGTIRGQKVAIVNIIDDARSTVASARPRSGNKYIVVEISIEDVGAAPVTLGTWTLHSTDNADYDRVTAAGFGQALDATLLLPGQKTQGTIVFEVPARARIQWLRYGPTPGKGALYFDTA